MMSFFFFSSRRRHTRFDCDWSSDVCSSDLAASWLKASAVRCKLLFLAGIIVLTAPLFAQSWRIADFQDVISISADGSTLVKERINLVFIGQWHGIHRILPIEYPGP